mmetsp:Transcript_12894/g.21071  ORF Transcript_12894/g.21071 Transcript_12894/m.21071 type:complete len:215 (-) Transcript_12894:381-1025(-)|eukprot:CAMPEP_0184663648 /NCGR_PEP_ID=MMETSP0308-20130426/49081_1 /TAXON_ID=38269 /ORGANISM="Gloeochaete witrockiana, Strain SAG 46.84" /LENGTH=214 /DNA_ID=CAMNT_0027106513 /DNA_START=241 /DNA_END=885 /DNA_ORIENTATION=-
MATLIHYGLPVDSFLHFSPLFYDTRHFLRSPCLTSSCGTAARSNVPASKAKDPELKPEDSHNDPSTETSSLSEATSSKPTSSVKKMRLSFERLARYDAHETHSEHVIRVELPGIDVKDIRVQVEKRVLEIESSREDSSDDVDAKIVFSRKLRLPESVNVEQIRACLEQGVLTIHIPKAPLVAFQVPIEVLTPASAMNSCETVSSGSPSQDTSSS